MPCGVVMVVLTAVAAGVVLAVVVSVEVEDSEFFFSSFPPQEINNTMVAPNSMAKNVDCFIDVDLIFKDEGQENELLHGAEGI